MPDAAQPENLAAEILKSVSVEVRISVGSARPTVEDLINLQSNAVLPLDKRIEDPVELFIGDKLIAKGQLEKADGTEDGSLVVRVTEIGDPAGGLT